MSIPSPAHVLVLRATMHGTTVAVRAVYISPDGDTSAVWPTAEAARKGVDAWLRGLVNQAADSGPSASPPRSGR